MAFGAVLIGLGWVLGGTIAHSIFHLYLYYGVVAGTGAGVIYISCVANAVKWFPDKRGLAAGLTAAGFGGGAALTIMPIAHSINTIGWASTMAIWGAAQGVIALLAAMMLRHPPAGWAPMGWDSTKKKAKTGVVQSKVNFTWTQTLRRPEFYLLYIMFLFAMMGGLIATANLSQIARSLNVNNAKVLGLAIIPLTATLASACNALSRIAWGTISDKLGRENTMFVAFGAEAILVYLVTRIAGKPITFVVLFSLIFLFWGEVYSLFSAATGDVFGPKNATGNYGMLYTAKGLASILAGFGAAALAAYFAGSFAVSFYASSILCAVASLFALFVLKPMVRARIAKEVPLAAAQAVGKASAAVAGGS
jgi:OFA family oxalate/formate antiporter-like MFS transporter